MSPFNILTDIIFMPNSFILATNPYALPTCCTGVYTDDIYYNPQEVTCSSMTFIYGFYLYFKSHLQTDDKRCIYAFLCYKLYTVYLCIMCTF